MKISLGYELVFDSPKPTPMILMLRVHPSRASALVIPDTIAADPPVPVSHYFDRYGNYCSRLLTPSGILQLSTHAVIKDSGLHDPVNTQARLTSVEYLPDETLLFLLGSRYCETEPLAETAWQLFSGYTTGWDRAQAICNYVHNHIEFGYAHARNSRTAFEVPVAGLGFSSTTKSTILNYRMFAEKLRSITDAMGYYDPRCPQASTEVLWPCLLKIPVYTNVYVTRLNCS